MSYPNIFLAAGIVFGLAGCTSAKLVPKVEAFGMAAAEQAKASRTYLENQSAEAAILKRRREAIIIRGGFYDFTECAPANVSNASLKVETEKLRFSERCSLTPMVSTADDEVVPLDMTDYGGVLEKGALAILQDAREDDDALRNGARIARGLETYATSLQTLATSTDQQQLAENFKTAADAIESAAIATAKARGEPVDTGIFAVAGTASGLAQKYLAEALEIARYNAIRTLVVNSDETVQLASRQVAASIDRFERGDSDTAYLKLQKEALALEAAYADGEDGAALLKRIETVEAAKLKVDEADGKRIALKVLGIARTHSAILTALQDGADIDDVLAAQDTIIELVEETDGLVKTVEKAGEAGS